MSSPTHSGAGGTEGSSPLTGEEKATLTLITSPQGATQQTGGVEIGRKVFENIFFPGNRNETGSSLPPPVLSATLMLHRVKTGAALSLGGTSCRSIGMSHTMVTDVENDLRHRGQRWCNVLSALPVLILTLCSPSGLIEEFGFNLSC